MNEAIKHRREIRQSPGLKPGGTATNSASKPPPEQQSADVVPNAPMGDFRRPTSENVPDTLGPKVRAGSGLGDSFARRLQQRSGAVNPRGQ